MKKLTLLTIALLVAAMSLAQATKVVETQKAKAKNTLSAHQNVTRTNNNTRAVTGTLRLCGDQDTNNGIGIGGAATLSAGARFEATDLTSYVGQYITRISVGIADATVISSAKVAILTGTIDAPVIENEQACSLIYGTNEVTLSIPYQIPAETAIMIAYEIVVSGGYPIGVDAGPAIENAGLLAVGELGTAFSAMGSIGLDYNNIISATIEDAVGEETIIAVYPSNLSFIGFVGEDATEAKAVSVNCINVSDDITITTDAPFEISTDNTSFATTGTLSEAGTFYVRYIPGDTETDNITGTVTVSTTGADSKTVSISAVTYNCSENITEFPYTESFDEGIPHCWTLVDADGDGSNWQPLSIIMGEYTANYTHSGNDAAMSASFDNALGTINANNWMFTQAIVIPTEGQYVAEWYAKSLDADYPDSYKAYVATSIDIEALANETPAVSDTADGTYERKSIDLSEYAGQTIYIAFNHNNYNNYVLILDDFSVFAIPETNDIALTSTTPDNGTTVIAGNPINISGIVTNNGYTLTSYTVSYSIDGGDAVEYNVSDINVAHHMTHEFTHPSPLTLEEGEHSINVSVYNPNGADDIDNTNNSLTITITAIECNAISEFPYTEDFENGISTCWTMIDADGDGHCWYFTSDLLAIWDPEPVEDISYFTHSGTGSIVSESFTNYGPLEPLNANNYLVTPEIALPSDGTYSLTFYTANIYGWQENLSVMISDNPTSFTTTLLPTESINVDQDSGEWAEKTVSLADYAGQNVYIAIVHTGYDGVGLLIDDVTIAAATCAGENIASAITVYPNPANSIITIANAEGQDIVIVNTLGQVVSEISNAAANQTIDISNLANGTYFVKVNAEIVKINIVK